MATVKLAYRQWSASLHNRPDRAAGAALKLRAPSHSCYVKNVIRCLRPGRVLGLAGPHLRPTGRAGPGRVLGQTTLIWKKIKQVVVVSLIYKVVVNRAGGCKEP